MVVTCSTFDLVLVVVVVCVRPLHVFAFGLSCTLLLLLLSLGWVEGKSHSLLDRKVYSIERNNYTGVVPSVVLVYGNIAIALSES